MTRLTFSHKLKHTAIGYGNWDSSHKCSFPPYSDRTASLIHLYPLSLVLRTPHCKELFLHLIAAACLVVIPTTLPPVPYRLLPYIFSLTARSSNKREWPVLLAAATWLWVNSNFKVNLKPPLLLRIDGWVPVWCGLTKEMMSSMDQVHLWSHVREGTISREILFTPGRIDPERESSESARSQLYQTFLVTLIISWQNKLFFLCIDRLFLSVLQ